MIVEVAHNFDEYRPRNYVKTPTHEGTVAYPFYIDMNIFTSCSITFFAYTC